MNERAVIVGQEARDIIDRTVELVSAAVTSTMGPNGKLVVIDSSGTPKMTKDGVTVAKAIRLEEKGMDIIASMITEASIKTDAVCGDGTTTTVFLTRTFYNTFKDKLNFVVKRRIDELTKESVELLVSMTHPVTLDSGILRSMATTTSNNDNVIVDVLYKIFSKIPDPNITYIQGVSGEDEVEYAKGLSFVGGFAHPSFSHQGTGKAAEIENGFVTIFEGVFKIPQDEAEIAELVAFTEAKVAENAESQFLILAREFDQSSLHILASLNKLLIDNKRMTKNFFLPIRIQAIGTAGAGIIGDIASVLNAGYDVEYEGWKKKHFASYPVNDLIVGMSTFFLRSCDEEAKVRVKERIEQINDQILQLPMAQKHSALAKILKHRISTLIGNKVTITVGGETASDIKERYDRFVDVGSAIASGLTNGALPGIGCSLARVGCILEKRYPDDAIVKEYSHALSRQVFHLMGREFLDPELVFVNLATGEEAPCPEDIGVWDAQLATVTALKAGVTTALSLASTDCLILGSRNAAVDIPSS